MRARLLSAADRPGFQRLMIALIAIWVLALLVQLAGLTAFTTPSAEPREVFRLGSHITNVPLSGDDRGFVRGALLVSTLIAVALALAGLLRFVQGRRAAAFGLLDRALLVSIFLIQVFAFAHSQFTAAIGLLADVGLFIAVRAMLAQELERAVPPAELR